MNEERADEELDLDDEQGEPVESNEPVIARLLRFAQMPNIATELEENELNQLGARVVKEYELDDQSRSEWKERHNKALKIASQVIEEKNYPWDGAANIKFPLITTAAIQFHARAYPAIIPGPTLVKGWVVGFDQDGSKHDRADRISKHMSYQLLDEMEEWEEDTDKLILVLSITGTVFRKSYYSQTLARNVSEMITADRLVVNYNAKSLARAPRVTHELELYPYEIEERIRSGVYLDVDLGIPDGEDKDAPIKILEQHRMEDLDDDGYPEPYVVTVLKDKQKVLRIAARYDEDRIIVDGGKTLGEIRRGVEQHNQQIAMSNRAAIITHQRAMEEFPHDLIPPPQMIDPVSVDLSNAKVQRIKPIQYFTKYGFLPSPDGGFYDLGFGMLLLAINEAINTNVNMLLDAGHMANTGAGIIGSNLKMTKKSAGPLKFRPMEFKRVETGGMPVRDAIYQFQFNGPSPVLFQLLGTLIEAGRGVASVKDIMTGDMPGSNTPATTTLAAIQQGMQVFSSIYKRIHRALGNELQRLYDLNAKYLPPQVYFNVINAQQPVTVGQGDYIAGDVSVKPVSDPNAVTDAQVLARAQALMPFREDPSYDKAAIDKFYMEAIKIDSPEQFLAKQPPSPPPQLIEMIDKMAREKTKLSAELEKMREEVKLIRAQQVLTIATAEEKVIQANASVLAAQTKLATEEEGTDGGKSGVRSNAGDDGMAGAPGDQEVQGVPQPVQGADGGLPVGEMPDAGAAQLGAGDGAPSGQAPGPVGA